MLEKNLLLIIIVLIVMYYINLISNKKEPMSLGTVQQMYAVDNQNIALNGYANSHIRSGDFQLRFNQPSKMISGTQRGARSNRANNLEVINDAYTGTYSGMPLFDIAGPIVLTDDDE